MTPAQQVQANAPAYWRKPEDTTGTVETEGSQSHGRNEWYGAGASRPFHHAQNSDADFDSCFDLEDLHSSSATFARFMVLSSLVIYLQYYPVGYSVVLSLFATRFHSISNIPYSPFTRVSRRPLSLSPSAEATDARHDNLLSLLINQLQSILVQVRPPDLITRCCS